MRSYLNWGPFGGPFYKGAVFFLGPEKGTLIIIENYPYGPTSEKPLSKKTVERFAVVLNCGSLQQPSFAFHT